MTFILKSFFKTRTKIGLLFVLLTLGFSQNSYCQVVKNKSDNSKTFMTIPLEFELPLNRNGLSFTAFKVTPSISIDRWQTKADIVLNIKKVQSNTTNMDPSYTWSYNYRGKRYGNHHIGLTPFDKVRADNYSVKFEVLVTYREKSWGWKEVDGMGNRFGPIDKNAKASDVNVSVRLVNVGSFSGTSEIEEMIRKLLIDSGENDIADNTITDVKPKPTVKPKPKPKPKQRPKSCLPGYEGGLDAKPFNPTESASLDNTNNQNYDKMSNTSKNLSLKRKPIAKSNKTINVKKPTVQSTPSPTDTDVKSSLNFNGRTIFGEADCEGSTVSFSTDDQNYFLAMLNLPSYSTSVNANYYTNACTECVAVQFQDLQQSKIYVATSGSITRNGNSISINVSVSDLIELIEGTGRQFQVSGTLSCDN